MRALIVGLDNPNEADPHKALWPEPEGTPGDRLRKLIEAHLEADYPPEHFVLDFARTNLYPTQRASTDKGFWDRDNDAFSTMLFYATELGVQDVVLLGVRLRDIFNRLFSQKIDYLDAGVIEDPLLRFWSLPHPSGKNYWYNDADNRKHAGRLLADLRLRQMLPRPEGVSAKPSSEPTWLEQKRDEWRG